MAAVAFGAPQHLIAPYALHAPLVYAAPAPVVETKVHYAETPVVVGHSAQILKPALAAPIAAAPVATVAAVEKAELKTISVGTPYAYPYFGFGAPLTVAAPVEVKKVSKRSTDAAEEKAAEPKELKTVPLAYAHPFVGPAHFVAYAAPAPVAVAAPAPLAYAAPAPLTYAVPAPAVFDIKAPVPAGDAPSMDVLVTKEKVLAPVRTTQSITPQITVQHPTKVNVEKVAIEVPVAQPYAHPVPVPVAPQYEIHQYHAPAVAVVA